MEKRTNVLFFCLLQISVGVTDHPEMNGAEQVACLNAVL